MKYAVMLLTVLVVIVGMPLVGAADNFSINLGVPHRPAPPPPNVVEPVPPLYEDNDGALEEGPSPLTFEDEPDMVVVPSGDRYIYMAPNYPGLYFYGGHWYRFQKGYWYRSPNYDRGWAYVGKSRVPRVVRDVPPEYVTYLPPNYHRIDYRDFHRGWRDWDRSRYWNKQDWYRNEMRSDVRRERYNDIRNERGGRGPAGPDVGRPGGRGPAGPDVGRPGGRGPAGPDVGRPGGRGPSSPDVGRPGGRGPSSPDVGRPGGRGPSGPDVGRPGGRGPSGPDVGRPGGRGPSGPGVGKGPAGPGVGKGPAGPGVGKGPAGPGVGKGPAGPGVGKGPGATQKPKKGDRGPQQDGQDPQKQGGREPR